MVVGETYKAQLHLACPSSVSKWKYDIGEAWNRVILSQFMATCSRYSLLEIRILLSHPLMLGFQSYPQHSESIPTSYLVPLKLILIFPIVCSSVFNVVH
jgi:hypothetical protein